MYPNVPECTPENPPNVPKCTPANPPNVPKYTLANPPNIMKLQKMPPHRTSRSTFPPLRGEGGYGGVRNVANVYRNLSQSVMVDETINGCRTY